jgi:hypothetical protein
MDIDTIPDISQQDMPLSNPQIQDYHPASLQGTYPNVATVSQALRPEGNMRRTVRRGSTARIEIGSERLSSVVYPCIREFK